MRRAVGAARVYEAPCGSEARPEAYPRRFAAFCSKSLSSENGSQQRDGVPPSSQISASKPRSFAAFCSASLRSPHSSFINAGSAPASIPAAAAERRASEVAAAPCPAASFSAAVPP